MKVEFRRSQRLKKLNSMNFTVLDPTIKSEDDEDSFLYFHDLGCTTYVLHEFIRVNTDRN